MCRYFLKNKKALKYVQFLWIRVISRSLFVAQLMKWRMCNVKKWNTELCFCVPGHSSLPVSWHAVGFLCITSLHTARWLHQNTELHNVECRTGAIIKHHQHCRVINPLKGWKASWVAWIKKRRLRWGVSNFFRNQWVLCLFCREVHFAVFPRQDG